MKKLNLNNSIKDLSGLTLSVAALQLRLSPGSTVTNEQRKTAALLASVALSGLDSMRGSQVTDEIAATAYSAQKKIYAGIVAKGEIELEDSEFTLVNNVFQNQATSIRGQYLEMLSELNPVAAVTEVTE